MINKIIILLLSISVASCSFIDGNDESPMYLSISDDVRLSVIADQGANTESIFAVSVYADGFNIGVYNLPAEVPVLSDNSDVNISISPVIFNNGQNDRPLEYPFYQSLDTTLNFVANTSVTIAPSFTYRSDSQFLYLEDFEDAHIIAQNVGGNENIAITRDGNARSGDFGGTITTDEDNPFFEKSTFTIFPVADVNNTFVFLELDYKNDIPLRVGILGITGNQGRRVYKIQLKESDTYNKIYLDLTEEVLRNNFDGFQLLFSNISGDDDYGSISLDNIKLISF